MDPIQRFKRPGAILIALRSLTRLMFDGGAPLAYPPPPHLSFQTCVTLGLYLHPPSSFFSSLFPIQEWNGVNNRAVERGLAHMCLVVWYRYSVPPPTSPPHTHSLPPLHFLWKHLRLSVSFTATQQRQRLLQRHNKIGTPWWAFKATQNITKIR